MNYIYLLFRGPWQKRHLGRYRRIVSNANDLESTLMSLSDDELTARLKDLHTRSRAAGKLDPLLAEILALGREFSRRALGMRHYDVQLMGTIALYEGHIAEMDTGEGKTLMAPLAAFMYHLASLDSCTHIVTANEYLADRDAKWMGPLYERLGMSVGLIVPGQSLADRAGAYRCDVVYATAKEIVFDSLRQPIRRKGTSTVDAILRPQKELQFDPKYDFAIVDEVDSVLIDQASSPLSVGGASNISPQLELYKRAHLVAGQLVRGKHYRLIHDDRKVELKDEGKVEARQRAKGVLRFLPAGYKWERYVVCALAARYIYKCDQQYVVRDGRIVLIDESTGRMLPGRQLPDGIHQAIEIYNSIIPSAELRGNLMTTFQSYFRKYKNLAGMTGTASTAAYEFMHVYKLAVVPIPSNKPSRRMLLPDRIYRSLKSKYGAVLEQIIKVHSTGRPVLIATGSVKISEHVSNLLKQINLVHDVLNAKNHASEAAIIAKAGQPGRITIITNMAGRGVDIVPGPGIAEKGGVSLIGTDRLHYRRLDDQLTGRIGRQGDPGDCQFFLSLKDDMMRFIDRKKIIRLRLKTRSDRDRPITLAGAHKIFNRVQRHISKLTTKQRQNLFRGEKQREKLKEQGLWEDWMDLR